MDNKYNIDDETLWERIRDKIPYGYRMERFYDDCKFSIRSWYQRRTQGYANSECWDLGLSTAKWILPRLKHFRENIHSTPPNMEKGFDSPGHAIFLEDDENQSDGERFSLTMDEWKDRLDKMIYAFEFILNEDEIINKCYPSDYNWGFKVKDVDGDKNRDIKELVWNDNRTPDYSYHEECKKRHVEGMRLFSLYIQHLWD